MVTAVVSKEKGIFQVTRKSYDTWSCAPVVYGSVVRFKAMEVSTADLNGLFRVFNLPLPQTETVENENSFIVEYVDDMPIEKLSRFGFPPSEISHAI